MSLGLQWKVDFKLQMSADYRIENSVEETYLDI